MTNKQRLEELERRMISPDCLTVVWEDPDQDGVYYDKPSYSPDRKKISAEELEALSADPGVIFKVSRTNDWRGADQDND